MSTAAAANAIRNSAMTPTRMFFRTSQTIPSMAHARTVFKALGEYGDMIEYKFLRVRSWAGNGDWNWLKRLNFIYLFIVS